jgi:hypothetical protein
MSEEPDAEARVRALLAGLGSGPDGETVPPDVAARLDETLARLVAERSEDQQEAVGADVVPLRRRWLPRLTASAAAVIVLGVAGVTAAHLGLFDGSSPAGKSDSTAGGSTTSAPSQPSTTRSSGAGGHGENRQSFGGTLRLPQIAAASFAADVGRLLEQGSALATPEHPTPAGAKRPPAKALEESGCRGPVVTDGAVPNLVQYDGRPAVLVVHPDRDGHRLVEAWDCSGEHRLAGATLTP